MEDIKQQIETKISETSIALLEAFKGIEVRRYVNAHTNLAIASSNDKGISETEQAREITKWQDEITRLEELPIIKAYLGILKKLNDLTELKAIVEQALTQSNDISRK